MTSAPCQLSSIKKWRLITVVRQFPVQICTHEAPRFSIRLFRSDYYFVKKEIILKIRRSHSECALQLAGPHVESPLGSFSVSVCESVSGGVSVWENLASAAAANESLVFPTDSSSWL